MRGSHGYPVFSQGDSQKVHRANWDDLRYVLAVADSGSVSAAARALGVNHATVLRRIAAFEQAHGGAVFQRGQAGYEVLPERLAVIEAARLAAVAFDQVSGLMRGDGSAERPIRVTSTDSLCQAVLPDVLSRPELVEGLPPIELCSGNSHRNLGRLEADITVRPTVSLPDDLVGLHAGDMDFAVYGARAEAVPEDAWLGVTGTLAASVVGGWFARLPQPKRFVASADSFVVLAELAARGRGLAVLPTLLGDRDPRLQRVESHGTVGSVGLWVASHVELAGAARLARVRVALAEGIGDWIAARAPGPTVALKVL